MNKIWHWVAKRFPDLLAGCRPVSFGENLTKAGFEITSVTEISQNTFPSEVISARKGKNRRRTGKETQWQPMNPPLGTRTVTGGNSNHIQNDDVAGMEQFTYL